MSVNKIFTVIGSRGTGKTPLIIGGDFEQGMAKDYLQKGMSTLILDEIDHVKYRHIPFLHPSKYSQLSTNPGIYRTVTPIQYLPGLVLDIARSKLVWNTLLVLEDCKKYIPQRFRDEAEYTLLGNSKQQNVDLVFMYWAWGIVPPDLMRNTNYYVIFPTADHPVVRESYLGGCSEAVFKAHEIVMRGKKPYMVVDSGI